MIEGGGQLHGAFVAAGLADRLVAYVAPCCSATRGLPVVGFPGPDTLADAARWRAASTSPSSAPTSASTYEPAPTRGRPDVHRHRRGARPGPRGHAATRAARASRSTRASCSTTPSIGASIAVNGCCLTVVELGDGWWAADAVTETLAAPASARSRAGDPVNLERPVRLADRLGGHLVQGHVDGSAARRAATPLPDGSTRMQFAAARRRCCATSCEKGSITVDGISLTVAALHDDGVRRRGHPAHARGHDARRRSSRAIPSTSKSTCSPSTSSDCSTATDSAPSRESTT